jgi:hypothetical protein
MNPAEDLFSFLAPSTVGGSTSSASGSSTPKDKEERKKRKKEGKKAAAIVAAAAAPPPSAGESGGSDDGISPAKKMRVDEGGEADEGQGGKGKASSSKVDDPMSALEQEDDAAKALSRAPETMTEEEREELPVVADEFEQEAEREVAPSAGLEAPSAEGSGIKLTHQVRSSHPSPLPVC